MEQTKTFDEALDDFVVGLQKIVDNANLHTPHKVTIRNRNSKWIAVDSADKERSGSVLCFIASQDNTTRTIGTVKRGDVMKAASWKVPAKHPRGNIFDDTGLGCMTWTGARYLK